MEAPASRHGHDVLHLLLEAEAPMTPEQILERVTSAFGADARFHTCSREGLDVPTLLAMFFRKGKIVQQGGGYVVAGHRICNH
ncbi:MAG: YecH family protein [Deltaproteobacteria bacterium]|nr:YecH family protein [Deltaproteobacteria bacterium]